MSFAIDRSVAIQAYIDLINELGLFNLVRQYNGEWDRYKKITQIEDDTFPAEVNLTTPFALVVSKKRNPDPMVKRSGPSLKLVHHMSVYIGVSNDHDIGSQEISPIFTYLDAVAQHLVGKKIYDGKHASTIELIDDGEYLVTTDLFVVYDQKYIQKEIAT